MKMLNETCVKNKFRVKSSSFLNDIYNTRTCQHDDLVRINIAQVTVYSILSKGGFGGQHVHNRALVRHCSCMKCANFSILTHSSDIVVI